jgi:hypothetical protein
MGMRTVAAAVTGGVIGAGIAVGLTVAIVGSGGSSHHPSSAPTSTTSTTVPLSATASDMLHLLSLGAKTDYHATYQVSSGTSASQGASVTLELWRRPPQVRQDTVVKIKGSSSDTAAFQIASGLVECTQQDKKGWSCVQGSGQQSPSSPQQLATSAAEQLAGARVQESSATIAGRSAQCFSFTVSGDATEICIDGQGIPLKLSSGGSTMTMMSIDHSLPAGVFTPPEAPS